MSIRVKILGIVAISVAVTAVTLVVSAAVGIGATGDAVAETTLVWKLEDDLFIAREQFASSFGTVRLDDGHLVAEDGTPIGGDHAFVDDLASLFGVTATVFGRTGNDFERLTTNIRTPDGNRATGTMLGTESAAYDPVMDGTTYFGSAQILGTNYLTVYDPIEEGGEIVGILYLGIARTEIESLIGETTRRYVGLQALIGAVVLGASLVLAFIIARAITSALSRGVDFAVELSNGNLNTHLDVDRKDELGDLSEALRTMVDRLRGIVGDIRSATDSVASGSAQVSQSAQQLSSGATEQAASAEEVSSSMEQMSSNIRQNADNALQTEKLSQKSSSDAEEGGQAVRETVAAMKEIAEKISIIEEIARNTNLLALNAAIEAARAGEAGKGFAVVASEVRKLAERSQTAAGEISELSTRSVAVAERAGEMLEQIVPDIKRTAELVQEISAASNEQNSGAEQINSAINQLDTVIQGNASASEEMASMSEELSGQAEQLQSTIAFFKTDESKGSGGTRQVAQAAPRGSSRWTSRPVNTSSKKSVQKQEKGIVLDDMDGGESDDLDGELPRVPSRSQDASVPK